MSINQETQHQLQEIAKLKEITVDEAIQLVLERYATRAKNEIERAYKAADNAQKIFK